MRTVRSCNSQRLALLCGGLIFIVQCVHFIGVVYFIPNLFLSALDNDHRLSCGVYCQQLLEFLFCFISFLFGINQKINYKKGTKTQPPRENQHNSKGNQVLFKNIKIRLYQNTDMNHYICYLETSKCLKSNANDLISNPISYCDEMYLCQTG